jgi:hypothetical protein
LTTSQLPREIEILRINKRNNVWMMDGYGAGSSFRPGLVVLKTLQGIKKTNLPSQPLEVPKAPQNTEE